MNFDNLEEYANTFSIQHNLSGVFIVALIIATILSLYYTVELLGSTKKLLYKVLSTILIWGVLVGSVFLGGFVLSSNNQTKIDQFEKDFKSSINERYGINLNDAAFNELINDLEGYEKNADSEFGSARVIVGNETRRVYLWKMNDELVLFVGKGSLQKELDRK